MNQAGQATHQHDFVSQNGLAACCASGHCFLSTDICTGQAARHTSGRTVLVHEQDGLRASLLAAARARVLVALLPVYCLLLVYQSTDQAGGAPHPRPPSSLARTGWTARCTSGRCTCTRPGRTASCLLSTSCLPINRPGRRGAAPAAAQFSCTNRMDCALHFWPLHAYASWSHCFLSTGHWIMSTGGKSEKAGRRTRGRPVLVHEQDGLRAALLAAARVRVLVALPGHVVRLSHIRSQDLPVEARVLQEYLRTVTSA